MFGYQNLMRETYLAHKNFKDEWKNWERVDKKLKSEPESVTNARNNFFQKLDLLYSLKIEPLEKKFRDNPNSAMDELIEFLSVDIPCFRCGYAKEVFLHWLKNTELSSNEVGELQQVALKMCETNNVRREFRRWCRLMIKLADADFVLQLKNLVTRDELFTRLKASWMLELIEKHRTDLRET